MNAEQDGLRRPSTASGGPGGTTLLRPNADVTSQWTVCCRATTAWDALNDNVTQAQTSIPAEAFIYASALNQTTEVALSTATLNGTPTTSRAWFYMDTAPGQTVRADVIWGGAVRGTTTVPGSASYQWRSISVVPPTQAAVDDLRIRFTITTAGCSTRRRLRRLLRAGDDGRRAAAARPDRDPAHRHGHWDDHRSRDQLPRGLHRDLRRRHRGHA